MGLNATGGEDLAPDVVSGSFAATGQSGNRMMLGYFNLSIWGTFSGSVQLERTFDAGSNWLPVAEDPTGTKAAYTTPVSVEVYEPEAGVFYRLNCTAYVSGTINYRISGGPRLT